MYRLKEKVRENTRKINDLKHYIRNLRMDQQSIEFRFRNSRGEMQQRNISSI